MRKRLAALMVLLLVGSILYAAAPTVVHYAGMVNSKTVDNQWTATAWDSVHFVIATSDDSAAAVIKMSGVAVMDQGDRLYVGFSNAALSSTAPSLDTFLLSPRVQRLQTQRHSFAFEYVLEDSAGSAISVGGTDTIWFVAAAGGGGITEAVTLEDVVITVDIIDKDNSSVE